MKKSVYYSLFTALCVSSLLSGCRFGNHADQAQPLKNAGTYKSIDLFFTDPTQLETRVYLNSLSGPTSIKNENPNAPFSAIPATVFKTFTSIVYFAVPNDPATNPSFFDSNGGNQFFTKIDANGSPAYSSPLPRPEYVLWKNAACGITNSVIHEGSFDRSQPGNIQVDGSTIHVAGSLNFKYTYSLNITSYNGNDNCTEDLTYLANCYTGAACPSSDVDFAKTLFDVAFRSGVLTIQDAPKLKALEYIVHYQ